MPEQLKPPPRTESLSLSEMMRIMDVATEMRTRRETVEKEFALDETKRMLREKLLQTTSITGERVTEAEVDAAIETYFNTLYVYQEPKGSLAVMLARFYVRRGHIAILMLLGLTLAGTGWLTMHLATTRFSQTARAHRKAARLSTAISSNLERVRALAREKAVNDELGKWEDEARIASEQLDLNTLGTIENQLNDLSARLNESYEVSIVADPQERSGFPRYFEKSQGRPAAYYLIVSAKDDRGQPVRRTILNSETQRSSVVDRWAEQVPKEVFDRIAADKKADGILNETQFSIKQRGYRDEEIQISGADGKPLTRLGQITEW